MIIRCEGILTSTLQGHHDHLQGANSLGPKEYLVEKVSIKKGET
jgi:hypothetical protein